MGEHYQEAMLKKIYETVKVLSHKLRHTTLPEESMSLICPCCSTEIVIKVPVPITLHTDGENDRMVYRPAGDREDYPCE